MRRTLALLIILLVACTPQGAEPQTFRPTDDVSAETFGSAAELQAFIEEHGSDDGTGVLSRTTAVMESVADSAALPAERFSETNVQVAGIDEADILKTDGEHIYTITENTVFIVSSGEDARVVSTIRMENTPQGMFIRDGMLAVFGRFDDRSWYTEHDISPRSGMTYVNVYDVTDADEPELVEEYKFEGQYFQGRMTDGWVYLVVRSMPEVRPLPMPLVVHGEEVGHVSVSDIAYYPIPYDRLEFASVHAFRLDGGDVRSKTVAVDGAEHMYMSSDNIYLTSTEHVNEWSLRQDIHMELLEPELTSSDRELIRKIENTDPAVLSKQEKRQKTYNVYQRYIDDDPDFQERVDELLVERLKEYESSQYTIIHKLSVQGGMTEIGASGRLPGTVNNQFSMDEHDGVFRVAVTLRENRWRVMPVEPLPVAEREVETSIAAPDIMPPRSETENRVYTLDDDLEVMDVQKGIAPGEQIFSTRFVRDRLYMVTFRQVDPFFVVDLSDPEDIEMLGELKIPGFSRYLHPYDDDHIIGIGRQATSTGRQQGIKISLFNVEDVSDPEEVANWVAEEQHSQTTAEWEHKAFLFDRERELLVIPAYSHDWRSGDGYNGAMVFRIDTEDIELRGLIDHSDGEQRYGPAVERSLYIGDLLYTKSPYLLRANDLDTLEGVARVELKPTKRAPYPVY